MEKEIVWTETALNQLEEIYFYILEHSLSYTISDKVIDQIFVATSVLKKNWDLCEIGFRSRIQTLY